MSKKKNSTTLTGHPLSGRLAVGKAFTYRDILQREHDFFEFDESELEKEYARIKEAIEQVKQDLSETEDRVIESLDKGKAAIFTVQREMLSDPQLADDIRKSLELRLVNAETVIKAVFRKWERQFETLADPVMKQKASDIRDLCRRILHALTGIEQHPLENMPEGSILVAKWLLPSDTVAISRQSILGVVLEMGGPASHAALLTREMGIACVAGIKDIFEVINDGDELLVDGHEGKVIIHPTVSERSDFLLRLEQQEALIAKAHALRHEPAITSDGVAVEVLANICDREDAIHAVDNGCDGTGLFRTESIYLAAKKLPTSEELFEVLNNALSIMNDKPVVLRLVDIGGDKRPFYLETSAEENSFLGLRGIRFLLAYPDVLKEQLRAFVRLSERYEIKILVPMITLVEDLQAVRAVLSDLCREMGAKTVPPLGAMLETPAAALCADTIAAQADFLSVGSNDLTQYTLAVGRENPRVNQYFVDDHPAILELLKITLNKAGTTPVSICGELAGRVEAIPMLLKLGFRSFSVAAPLVPVVKQAIRKTKVQPTEKNPHGIG